MSPQDEYRKRLNDRYASSRSDGLVARWRAISPAARKYIVAGVVIVVILIVVVANAS